MDLQLFEDNGYKFILNYQDCFNKFIILRPLKTKTAVELADCLMGIFFEHVPPSLAEYSNDTLMVGIKELWTSTRIVHGRPRHPEDQGSVELANKDFKLMFYAWLKDVKKEYDQWVSELPFIQYCKNNAHHSGIRGTPYCVHFGRAPADLSVNLNVS